MAVSRGMRFLTGSERAADAAQVKNRAVQRQFVASRSLPRQRTNLDEIRYAGERYYGSFTKCLPQNEFGEVDEAVFKRFRFFLDHGDDAGLSSVQLDSTADRKLANPLGAFRFEQQGLDGWATRTPPPPSFRSAATAAEMVELYWLAHTRDVPFADYATDPLIAEALADINALSAPVGPAGSMGVTAETLFRGETAGDLVGPYVSQFLLQTVPYGPSAIEQRYAAPVAGDDYHDAPD